MKKLFVLLVAALLVALSLAPSASAGVRAELFDPDADPRAANASYRFISSPDFLNADVGTLDGLPRWDGQADSTNASWNSALDQLLDTWDSRNPGSVLVAGDTVEGHWGQDFSGAGYFGTYDTLTARQNAIRTAGNTYYPQWKKRFTDRGLVTHVAVGDHEIGDNGWNEENKRTDVPIYKDVFADNLIATNGYRLAPTGSSSKTAYARYISPGVLLVSVDVFYRTSTSVTAQLDPAQLDWLDSTLANAKSNGTEWIIVQGHTPVLGPVRQAASSGLMFTNGADSGFWKTMVRHGVDVYLSGEVHNVTVRRQDGITQISHGGIFPHLTSWMQADIANGQMRMTMNRFDMDVSLREDGAIWGNDPRKAPGNTVTVNTPSQQTGSLVISNNNQLVSQSGEMAVYRATE